MQDLFKYMITRLLFGQSLPLFDTEREMKINEERKREMRDDLQPDRFEVFVHLLEEIVPIKTVNSMSVE